jgi:capsid protein
MAWIVYGTDYRQDEVRGQPLLSLVLTSIKELDRYRDSEQRAATINSLLAMFIERQRPNVPTLPVSGGALRNDRINGTGLDGQPRQYNLANNYPGMVFEELAPGEIPHSFDTRRPNVNYQAFEEAVVAAIAWASEVPPEVLRLSFSSNYSASKAAINEFKSYITRVRGLFGANVCQPIYCEWLITEALANRVTNSQGLLASWRDASRFAEFGAWTRAEWGGPVKPSIELSKDVKAYGEAIELRLISRDRACKDLFGVRFSTVVRRVKKELELLEDIGGEGAADAQPDAQGGTPGGIPAAPSTPQTLTEARVLELIAEEIEENQPTPLREVS